MDNFPEEEVVRVQHRELMEFLTDNDAMRKAAKHSVKQGLYAGGGAVAGGLLLGPVGGLVGGIAGSVVGFFQAEDYDGALLQLNELDAPRKQKLIKSVGVVLTEAGAAAAAFQSGEAFRGALVQFALQRQVRDRIWKACVDAMR